MEKNADKYLKRVWCKPMLEILFYMKGIRLSLDSMY